MEVDSHTIPESLLSNQNHPADQYRITTQPDLFESCSQSITQDLKEVSLLDNDNPTEQVREINDAFNIVNELVAFESNSGDGFVKDIVDVEHDSTSTNVGEFDLAFPSAECSSTSRPHFLSDSDTTEISLLDSVQV